MTAHSHIRRLGRATGRGPAAAYSPLQLSHSPAAPHAKTQRQNRPRPRLLARSVPPILAPRRQRLGARVACGAQGSHRRRPMQQRRRANGPQIPRRSRTHHRRYPDRDLDHVGCRVGVWDRRRRDQLLDRGLAQNLSTERSSPRLIPAQRGDQRHADFFTMKLPREFNGCLQLVPDSRQNPPVPAHGRAEVQR